MEIKEWLHIEKYDIFLSMKCFDADLIIPTKRPTIFNRESIS